MSEGNKGNISNWRWLGVGSDGKWGGGVGLEMSAEMAIQGCASPREEPGFYSVGSGGISTEVAKSIQVFLKGYSGCYIERGLEGSRRKIRAATG